MKHFKLGASIYVPATHKDLVANANEEKIKARSMIFCTEDAVNEKDVPQAVKNLENMLVRTTRSSNVLKFIRVRNEKILKEVLQLDGIQNIDGFVFPKITALNYLGYHDQLVAHKSKYGHDFEIMPTLETKETFNHDEMNKLCDIFMKSELKNNILSLRIGGNDLLNILGIRRSRYRTIYETPLGVTISNLVTIFKANGFNLTSPVCEFLYDHELLQRELPTDLEYGLFGKTAIHPDQISIIESFYQPSEQDVEMAIAILKEDAPAVFGMHGTMCEKATHTNWAKEILARSEIYGIFGARCQRA